MNEELTKSLKIAEDKIITLIESEKTNKDIINNLNIEKNSYLKTLSLWETKLDEQLDEKLSELKDEIQTKDKLIESLIKEKKDMTDKFKEVIDSVEIVN